VYTSPPDRPERMYQRDRPVIPHFDGTESLYLRYGVEDLLGDRLEWSAIHFPRTSVNRGALSEPEDVLFDETGKYNGLGVVGFAVSDIPPRITQNQGPAYVFFMHHDPHPDNYSHSEIWSDQLPPKGIYKEPGKSVKLEFRIQLSQRISRQSVRIPAVRNRVNR
jgi:hypothetical protein